jgi:hypothetical protein
MLDDDSSAAIGPVPDNGACWVFLYDGFQLFQAGVDVHAAASGLMPMVARRLIS